MKLFLLAFIPHSIALNQENYNMVIFSFGRKRNFFWVSEVSLRKSLIFKSWKNSNGFPYILGCRLVQMIPFQFQVPINPYRVRKDDFYTMQCIIYCTNLVKIISFVSCLNKRFVYLNGVHHGNTLNCLIKEVI